MKRKDSSEESELNEARDRAYSLKDLADQVFNSEELQRMNRESRHLYGVPSLDHLIELKRQGKLL